jgi:hypothetical protein
MDEERDTVKATIKAAFFLMLVPCACAFAAEFKSDKECVIGSKVANRENRTGTVIAVDGGTCRVRLDGDGKTIPYLFWMLHAAGGSKETNDKLVVGRYDCYVGSQGTGDMRITSASTYESGGKKGKYHVEASNKIVFESGPFSSFNAKLLAGPRIGMNMNGGTFYNMTCDPGK